MKKLFFASLMAISFLMVAHAAWLNPNMSWEEINGTDGVFVRYPTIQVHGVFLTYDMFCVDGETLVADSNYQECVQWGEAIGDNDPECIRYQAVEMTTPITYQDRVCTEWIERGDNVTCGNWQLVERRRKLTVKADVFFDRGIGENPEEELFSKDYTIPACM